MILYRFPNSALSLCDINSLTASCQKLVSGSGIKTFSIMFYRYKVAKNIFFGRFKVHLCSNCQNTVSNIAKRHCVTFWKFFRMLSYLDYLTKKDINLLFLSVEKPCVKRGLFATFGLCIPLIEISEL